MPEQQEPNASEYIASRIASAKTDEVKQTLTSISELHGKKLWHQLTELIREALNSDDLPDKRGLYTSFIKTFETKLNPVSLVQLLSTIVHSELQHSPTDALKFISHLSPSSSSSSDDKSDVLSSSSEAHILLYSLSAELYLSLSPVDLAQAKASIDSARSLLDATDVQPDVHSAYYRACALQHKAAHDATLFYRAALQYLAYTDPSDVPDNWATDIALAALTSDDVYNFGEVVTKSIILSLAATPHAWLLELLHCFNDGDRAKYDALCVQHAHELNSMDILVRKKDLLDEKIIVLALLRLAFKQSLQHAVKFSDIVHVCKVKDEEVEFLVMRAMSIGLLDGVIDNVDQSVSINRVKPRVLDRKPIAEMADRLAAWCANVNTTVDSLKLSGAGIIES